VEDTDQLWSNYRYVSIDLEGDGSTNPNSKEIISVAAVEIKQGQPTSEHFYSLVNPGKLIRQGPGSVHGLTDNDVVKAPTFSHIKKPLLDFIGNSIIIAHNAWVDNRLLKKKAPEFKPEIVLDTLKLSRTLYPKERGHSLDNIAKRLELNIKKDFDYHNPLDDATIAGLILCRLIIQHLPNITLEKLDKMCGIIKKEDSRQQALF
jgi:DNA polymerase III epsilon subunit family exonuclease